LVGDLLRCRAPAFFLLDLLDDPIDAPDLVSRVYRQADQAALLRQCPRDALTNPPGGIGTELVATVIVELFHGLHETDVALLDEVKHRYSLAKVLFGHANHQARVGFYEPCACLLAEPNHLFELFTPLIGEIGRLEFLARSHTGLDPLGQHDLFFCCQEGHLAHLL